MNIQNSFGKKTLVVEGFSVLEYDLNKGLGLIKSELEKNPNDFTIWEDLGNFFFKKGEHFRSLCFLFRAYVCCELKNGYAVRLMKSMEKTLLEIKGADLPDEDIVSYLQQASEFFPDDGFLREKISYKIDLLSRIFKKEKDVFLKSFVDNYESKKVLEIFKICGIKTIIPPKTYLEGKNMVLVFVKKLMPSGHNIKLLRSCAKALSG